MPSSKKFCFGIEEQRDALAGGQALLRVLRLDGFCAAAFADGGFLPANLFDQREHSGGVSARAWRFGVKFCGQREIERG